MLSVLWLRNRGIMHSAQDEVLAVDRAGVRAADGAAGGAAAAPLPGQLPAGAQRTDWRAACMRRHVNTWQPASRPPPGPPAPCPAVQFAMVAIVAGPARLQGAAQRKVGDVGAGAARPVGEGPQQQVGPLPQALACDRAANLITDQWARPAPALPTLYRYRSQWRAQLAELSVWQLWGWAHFCGHTHDVLREKTVRTLI
jgi:hypothetical protein